MWAWSKVVGGYENSGAYIGALPHCTMPDKISVSPNESLCYQLWNPNKVSNTGNYTRIAWYTSDGTYIKSDELPRLDGVVYYCQTYTAPSNAYYAMLGTMIAPNETIANTVTKTKWERGNKPTDWTPALEDSLTLKDKTTCPIGLTTNSYCILDYCSVKTTDDGNGNVTIKTI